MNTVAGTAFYYGTMAERLAFTPALPHVYFYATDTSIMWFWDGIKWVGISSNQVMIPAASVTLTAGTSSNTVADLRHAHDGLFYTLTESNGTPGQNIIIDFINVLVFDWVRVIGTYNGSASHAVAIQLYKWSTSTWDTFDAMQSGIQNIVTPSGYVLEDHSVRVFIPTDYVGTGANAGRVRVRLYHPMNGNPSHRLYLDSVALFT